MSNSVKRRRKELLEVMGDQRVVSIRQMSDLMRVSQSTLRRDLDALEEEGLVERIHGSARLVQAEERPMDKQELWFFNRQEVAVEEKKAIARTALQLVERHDVIMMDASTTGFALAQLMPDDSEVTVLTHSAYLPIELAKHADIQVISTGGLLHPRSMCYLGIEAENTLQHLHAHRAFFGVKGLTIREGCTDVSPLEVRLKAAMQKAAQELIVLADHTKLGNVALASFAPITRVSTLITDESADPSFVESARDLGVNVILAAVTSAESDEL